MCRHSLSGNREVSWLTKAACRDWSASGRRGAEADDARPREVRLRHSSDEVAEPAAEAMERRAGAEENASQPRTRRTQSRESVSQTPERVRTAARFCRHYPRWEPDAGCVRRSWYELASASLVRPKPSKQDGSESYGRHGNVGSGA